MSPPVVPGFARPDVESTRPDWIPCIERWSNTATQPRIVCASYWHTPPIGRVAGTAAASESRDERAPMKAITIRNPYAWAVATGRKDVENRTRPVSHRGDIAIHAGAAWFPDAEWDRRIIAAWWGEGRPGGRLDVATFPAGWFRVVLAVADLYDCHVPEPGCCTSEWAEPGAGAHLLLRNVRRLAEPVPARGALGLWTVPDDVEALIGGAL